MANNFKSSVMNITALMVGDDFHHCNCKIFLLSEDPLAVLHEPLGVPRTLFENCSSRCTGASQKM